MKVLYISPNGYLGGAERFICNAAQGHHHTQNIEFHILFYSDGEAAKLCRELGVTVHILPIKFKMRRPLLVLKACLYLREYIKKNQFDIIHSTMPYAQIISFLSTLFLDIKRVWFQHGPVGGILDKIANLTPVDRIYFNSHYLEKEHLKMLFSKRNLKKHIIINLGVLENTVDNKAVESIIKTHKSSAKYLFLNVGRICRGKGQIELIEAINLLRSSHNNDFFNNVKVLIVGSFGSLEDEAYEKEAISKVKEYKLSDNIIFLGHKNNIQDYYKASDVFVHTSTIPESFGLVIAESMKNNCLVIGSDTGGVTDILINNKTGFSYPSLSKDRIMELAKVLQTVYQKLENDKADINSIKSTALKLITSHYSIDQMTHSLEKDYQTLLRPIPTV